MKHVKNKPPDRCEYFNMAVPYSWHTAVCGKPAKYEYHFADPKAKPMMVCGNHKRVMERRK